MRGLGDKVSLEYRLVARDGSVHWFQDESTIVEDPEGGPEWRVHGFLLETNERKPLEAELQRARDDAEEATGQVALRAGVIPERHPADLGIDRDPINRAPQALTRRSELV